MPLLAQSKTDEKKLLERIDYMIDNDKHYQDIKDVAKYNFATMGADFQKSHSENNISRTWRTEEEVMSNVVAYVGVI